MNERPTQQLTVDEICEQLDMGIAEALVYCYHELLGVQDLTERQGDQLRRVVNAIRGEPPEDTLWSHHDAGELAERARKLLDDAHHYVLQAANFDEDGTPRKYAGNAGYWLFKYHELVGIDIEGLIGKELEETFAKASKKSDDYITAMVGADLHPSTRIQIAKLVVLLHDARPHVQHAAEHGDARGDTTHAKVWLDQYYERLGIKSNDDEPEETCPQCGSKAIEYTVERIEFAVMPPRRITDTSAMPEPTKLHVDAPVGSCNLCGFSWTDWRADEARDKEMLRWLRTLKKD